MCGASIILGNNGYIWITCDEPTSHQKEQISQSSSESREQRVVIARLHNCISALAQNKLMIFDTTIQYTYEASLKFEVGIMQISCDCRV